MTDKTNILGVAAKQPVFEALQLLMGAGHELIPLNGKVPSAKGWRAAKPLEPEQAFDRLELAKGNVGVRLRPTDLVIDVDPRNFDKGDDPVRRLEAEFNIRLADWTTTVTGSGGTHHYMRVEGGQSFLNELAAYPGIEFKAFGRQVVAPGSIHPETGRRYVLRRPDPLDERVDAPAALLDLIRRSVGASAAEPGILTPDELADFLGLLDPTEFASNDLWFPVMAGSHHATGGDGLEEFLAWSAGDAGYVGHEARIAARWNSLRADSVGVRVTVGSLAELLRRKGHANAGNALSLKIDEANRSDPLDDFPDDFDDLPNFIDQKRPGDALLNRINESRFTVLTNGKYLVGRERRDERMKREVVDWSPDEAARKHMNIKSVETPEGRTVPLGDWWLKHPMRRQYDWVVFDPSPEPTTPDTYNLWRGWAVEPKIGDWSMLNRLLRDVLCRGDQVSYDYAMRWAAFMVQRPSTPAEVALVFKGPKGVGKGTFGRALKELAGQHGRQVAQPEHFTGRFNEHLADTILLFVDEGLWAGDKKVEGALKNLITEPTLTFEGKNKPIIEGPNHLHVVIASNEDWVIPATPDERRFAVFEADGDAKAKLPSGFFEGLNAQMQSGGLAAMLHDLLAADLGDWHPRRDIPQTEALAAQKVEGFRSDPIAFWWHRCLEDGQIDTLAGPSMWPASFDADSAGKDAMLLSLDAQARAMGKRVEFTKTKLARFLSKVGVDVRARTRQGGKVWAVPTLEEARADFDAWIGSPLDWDR